MSRVNYRLNSLQVLRKEITYKTNITLSYKTQKTTLEWRKQETSVSKTNREHIFPSSVTITVARPHTNPHVNSCFLAILLQFFYHSTVYLCCNNIVILSNVMKKSFHVITEIKIFNGNVIPSIIRKKEEERNYRGHLHHSLDPC
jgi:hypothetical protein